MEIREQLQRTLGNVSASGTDEAAEHYRRVIDLGKNADPDLQVVVDELKRRVTDIEALPR